MPKPDYAHKQTDKELEALERRISAEYGKAAKELQEKIDDYFAKFEKRDAETKKLIGTIVNGKEYTEQDYKMWRVTQIGRGKRFEALRDRVAERMTKANETAAAYINDATPGLYSLNRNYAAYTIEQVAGDVGFDLWDEQTVKRLIKEQPDLMPYYPPERAVKRGIDLKWGKQQITAQVTSGILQGESIKHLSDRLQKNIPDMNRTSAIRAARTAVTGAQNAGRMDSYTAAGKMGIKLKKEWLATLDGRTRHSHAVLDGEQAENEKKFSNGCMFPGDPNGPPQEIYNCRCTLIAAVDGVDTSDAQRRARDPETGESVLIEDMTYSEWAGWKKDESGSGTALNGDHYSKLPITLGGVERGKPMTFAEADNRAANPGYRKGTGTAENCQSCVVAHEARMRGYDVEAQSYSKNKTAGMLASDTRLAWVDPKTRDIPDFEPWDYTKQYDKRSYKEYLENTVKPDGRYTLEFKWKNATGGHIISVDRDETGAIRIYDPQTGKTYSKWEQDDLLGRMRYTDKYGRLDPPHLLRVDTLAFREDIMPDIVKEERAGWKRKAKADMEDDDDWIPF